MWYFASIKHCIFVYYVPQMKVPAKISHLKVRRFLSELHDLEKQGGVRNMETELRCVHKHVHLMY